MRVIDFLRDYGEAVEEAKQRKAEMEKRARAVRKPRVKKR